MSKRLVLFWLVVSPLSGLLAQSNCHFQLRGVVKDKDTQAPIPFAAVVVKEIAIGATTDENGRFTISNLCRQTYTLEISHIECAKHSEQFVIEDNTEGVFFLSHDEKLLKSVEVRDKRVALEATQANASLTGEDLRAAQGQLLADVLKTMAGVNTLNTGSNVSKPVIQGLHSDRVLIFNNGVRQEGQQWGLDHAPEIDPFIADKITVLKGAAGVRFGVGAIGGVILVEPRPLRDTLGMGGKISLMGFSNGRQGVVSSMLEGKLPSGLAWRVQGTAKRGGTQHTPQYNLQNTGVEELNGSLMLGYKVNDMRFELFYSHFYSKIGIFKESHIGNTTDLLNAIERGRPLRDPAFSYIIERPAQRINHDIVKLTMARPTGDIGRLNVLAFFQHNLRQEYDFHRPGGRPYSDFSKAQIAFQMPSVGLRSEWEHSAIRNWQGGGGVEGLFQDNNTFAGALIPDYRQMTTSVFWTERWRRYPHPLELEGGIRYDVRRVWVDSTRFGEADRTFQFNNLSASVGTIYHFSPKAKLSLNIGTAWRSPNVNELFSYGVHHGTASFERGDPTLVPERALNSSLSFHADYDWAELEASIFQNTIRNFIFIQPDSQPVLTIRGAFPAFSYRQTDAQLRGGDFTFNINVSKKWAWILKGSMVLAKDTRQNDWLPLMPPDRFETGFKFRSISINRLKQGFIEARWALMRQQNRVSKSVFDYAPPPVGYGLVHLALGSDVAFGKQVIEWRLGVDNLLNTRYRAYLDRFRYFTDAVGRNVSIKLNYAF